MKLTLNNSSDLITDNILLYELNEIELPRNYCFDTGHFNKEGTEIFSIKLGELYTLIMHQHNH